MHAQSRTVASVPRPPAPSIYYMNQTKPVDRIKISLSTGFLFSLSYFLFPVSYYRYCNSFRYVLMASSISLTRIYSLAE